MARSRADDAIEGSREMADLRLIVSGAAGRMGRMVVRTIHESDGFKLTGALEREDSPWLGQDPALLAGCPAKGLQIVADPLPLLLDADAIIDFSSPAASVALAGARRAGAHRRRDRHDRLERRGSRQDRLRRRATPRSCVPAT